MSYSQLLSCILSFSESNTWVLKDWTSLLQLTELYKFFTTLNPIQDAYFWSCSWIGGRGGKNVPLPKICHTYPKLIKLGSYSLPKEDPKNIWITWHNPWVLLTSAFFHCKSANFFISRNTDKDCILIHNF